jgi:Protein of unknown function (DUF4038)/F5/8 type C domain/Putative collagen-binding domain of a collagenase
MRYHIGQPAIKKACIVSNIIGLFKRCALASVIVAVTPSFLLAQTQTNIALNKPATASSAESSSYLPSYAFDGSLNTRWSSQFSDPQWIYVDLGSTYNVNEVKLTWEVAYGKAYQIQVSNDATNWTSIYSTTTGTGGVNDLPGLSGTGRYVRMYGTQRGTPWGYSLWEFVVYGTPASTIYPVKVGPTGRYLVDKNNVPFLITGDAPHDLICRLSYSDVDSYFADRQKDGYNSAWVEVLTDPYVACNSYGTTYDGIPPFINSWNFATPNPAYFSRLDSYINIAANHGITVFLDPLETGGLMSTLAPQGTTVAFNYGVYLGNRYKNFPNIVWITGNDYTISASTDPIFAAIMNGIKSVDLNHIQTTEYQPGQTSLDNATIAPYINLNSIYNYGSTYTNVFRAYNQTPTLPVFLLEAHYELENVGWPGGFGTPLVLRRQEYWTLLAGGLGGYMSGNAYTWPFKIGWKSNLDTEAAAELSYWHNFFTSYKWYNLVPDQLHTVVTAGYGACQWTNVSADDCLTTARVADGSLVIAYTPIVRTFTVDMTKLSGIVAARWFDPTNGSYTTVSGSPFANTGSRLFTPTGNDSAGAGDWILVLTSARK